MKAGGLLVPAIIILVLLGLVGAFFAVQSSHPPEKNTVCTEKNTTVPSLPPKVESNNASSSQTTQKSSPQPAKKPVLWSLKLSGASFVNSAVFGDVDGDGKEEILFRVGRTVGLVDNDGKLLWEKNFNGMGIGISIGIEDLNGKVYVIVGDLSGLHFLDPITGKEVLSVGGVRYPMVASLNGTLFVYSDGNLYRYSNGKLEFLDRLKGVYTNLRAFPREGYLLLYSSDRLLVYKPSKCTFREILNPPAHPFVVPFTYQGKDYIAVLASKEPLSAPSLLLLDPSTCSIEKNLYTSSKITDGKTVDNYLILFTFDLQGYHAIIWNEKEEVGKKTFPFYVADVFDENGLCFVGVRGGSLLWSGDCGKGSVKVGSDLFYVGSADVDGDGTKEAIVWDKESSVLSAVKLS